MGITEKLLKLRTDSKQISRRIYEQPGGRHQAQDGFDLGLLTFEFLAGRTDPDRKDSPPKNGKCTD
jgi:hypothetical protein